MWQRPLTLSVRAHVMASYTPDGYSQTSDYFAMVMVDAPEFSMNRLTLEDAFQSLGAGVQSVAQKTRNVAAQELLAQVALELSEVFQQFQTNLAGDPILRKAARKKLQRAYYDLYVSANFIHILNVPGNRKTSPHNLYGQSQQCSSTVRMKTKVRGTHSIFTSLTKMESQSLLKSTSWPANGFFTLCWYR
jgi:hypothetical protein